MGIWDADRVQPYQQSKEQGIQIVKQLYCEMLSSSHPQLRFNRPWIHLINLFRCDLLALRLEATSIDHWKVHKNFLTRLTIGNRTEPPLLNSFV